MPNTITPTIEKTNTINNEIFSYNIEKALVGRPFRVNEYANYKFQTDFEFHTKTSAITFMKEKLTLGDNRIELLKDNELYSIYRANNGIFRFDKILLDFAEIDEKDLASL